MCDKIGNEERLLLLETIYKDNIAEKHLDEIEYRKLSEKKLLTSLKTDNYKIRSLLIYNLKKHGLFNKMPYMVKEFLNEEEKRAKEKFDQKISEIKYIQKKLSDIRRSFLILKGAGMAYTVYKEKPYIRDFNDIDILVEETEADNIYKYFLESMGYVCKKGLSEQLIYKNFFQHYAPICREGVYVEMHHHLTQKQDPYYIDTKRIMNNADILYIDNMPVYIPNKEDMLISLCYHLFQHEYREARFMLKPYPDIYNLLYSYKDNFEWNKLIENVKKDKIEFPVIYSLYCVNHIYKELLDVDIVPENVLDVLMPKDFYERKDAIVSRHLFNNDEIIGVWSKTHKERLFMGTKELRQELCRKYFFYTSEKYWKEECNKLNIPFEENFEFSPRIWEKYGRI